MKFRNIFLLTFLLLAACKSPKQQVITPTMAEYYAELGHSYGMNYQAEVSGGSSNAVYFSVESLRQTIRGLMTIKP